MEKYQCKSTAGNQKQCQNRHTNQDMIRNCTHTTKDWIQELVIRIWEKQLNREHMLTISGNWVSCSTLVTVTPELSSAVAVPPVETMVYLQFNRGTIITAT